MVLKKIRIAQRFPDLETAFGFAEENKIAYDEVILLFEHVQDVPEQPEEEAKELPEQNIDKDKLIQDLLKENAELKEGEIPKPTKPLRRGLLGKKAPTGKTEIRATK